MGYEGYIRTAKFCERVSDLSSGEVIKAALRVATTHGLGRFELTIINLKEALRHD